MRHVRGAEISGLKKTKAAEVLTATIAMFCIESVILIWINVRKMARRIRDLI